MEVLLDVVSVEPQKDNTLLLLLENQEMEFLQKAGHLKKSCCTL